ncbi:MAG: hypothetical protein C7B46_05015 [Sulfobacillus benefaciens]|uniref:Uncharacterized protein n=1 Tax=Sulfobacillus benefaciens TaxID=453960 RepID=A0A2T2XJ81_9FIRM|nr:MAG: hypothetical protein C7B46_05015 [Sulfobacillus benefaciens]
MQRLQSEWARTPKTALLIITGVVILLSVMAIISKGQLPVPYPSALDSRHYWMRASGWYFANLLGLLVPLLSSLPVLVMESDVLASRRVIYVTYPMSSWTLFLLRIASCLSFSVGWMLVIEVIARIMRFSFPAGSDVLLVIPDILFITFAVLAAIEWTTDLWAGFVVIVLVAGVGLGVRNLPFPHPHRDELVLFAARDQLWSWPLLENRIVVALASLLIAGLAAWGFHWHRQRGSYQ